MVKSLESRASEQGSAMVLAIFSLMIVSGLAAAMLASGRTDILISRNQERAALAGAAAEAGLNHGTVVTTRFIRQWQTNGFASSSAAMSFLMRGPNNLVGGQAADADNGSLETFGIPRPPGRATLSAGEGTTYEVSVMDEDDPRRGFVPSAADLARIGEDGNSFNDFNQRIVVRATGFGPGGTRRTLEATIGPEKLPAIVANGDLLISGNPTITGVSGSVHTNGDLAVSGNPTVEHNATASGNYTEMGSPTVGGMSGGGFEEISVPTVNAADYKGLADFILHNDGRMTLPNGTLICDASSNHNACSNLGYGWKWQNTYWDISGNSASGGTYYVETDAKVTGSPGSNGSPMPLSIIAEGSIEIAGNPDLKPDLPELMFVTDRDLKINGNVDQPISFEGVMLVHEQVFISGNPALAGQIIVENAANVSTLVDQNTIAGNMTLTYNGLVGSNSFRVIAWREVRP